MLRKIIQNINEWLEDRIRHLVRPLSPDARVILIVTMLILFSGLSIYMTISSIYNFGKDKGRKMEIKRMEILKPELEQERQDSINYQLEINEFEYGRTENQ